MTHHDALRCVRYGGVNVKAADQPEQDQHEATRLIDFKDLGPRKGVGYSRDHLRRKWKAGTFPTPVALSNHRIAWREAEVDEWVASRPRRTD
jgi:predicted DNA-binding transcriptional regulator AlpA